MVTISAMIDVGEPEEHAAPDDPQTLGATTIVNASPNDLVAFVSAGGIEWRLGDLPAGDKRTFPLPALAMRQGSYCLVADMRDRES
jgi:hypothetical protein